MRQEIKSAHGVFETQGGNFEPKTLNFTQIICVELRYTLLIGQGD